jgi:hypothetical protein
MLEPARPRTVAVRMLRNLAGSYQRRARVDKLSAVTALVAALERDADEDQLN